MKTMFNRISFVIIYRCVWKETKLPYTYIYPTFLNSSSTTVARVYRNVSYKVYRLFFDICNPIPSSFAISNLPYSIIIFVEFEYRI